MVRKIFQGDSCVWKVPYSSLTNIKFFSDNCQKVFSLRVQAGDDEPVIVELKIIEDSNSEAIEVLLTDELSQKLPIGHGVLIAKLNNGAGFQLTEIVDEVDILSNPNSKSFNSRSFAQRNLEQAQNALAIYTSTNGRVKSYTIGTRSTTFNSIGELKKLVDYWKAQVYLEECSKQGIDPRTYLAEFV
ncbi:hypothetical protein [Turicimonas muris]|uniref:hypothetical protein n=1 Tax=Turicimonas muris TaxID=1796652 RepID=UPI00248C893E|nr:hypothetical protein [Turicimonas muris]